MSTTKFIFNRFQPLYQKNQVLDIKSRPDFFDILKGQHMFKYADYNFAYQNSTPIVRNILDMCPVVQTIFPISKNIKTLVDVKIHSLSEGECPCIPGWHIDGHPNPFKYDKSYYHLFLIGPEDTRTLFIDHPVELDVEEGNDEQLPNSYVEQLKNIPVKSIHLPENVWCSYTNTDFHSGPYFASKSDRLLVRVAQTTHILPRNVIVKKASSFK